MGFSSGYNPLSFPMSSTNGTSVHDDVQNEIPDIYNDSGHARLGLQVFKECLLPTQRMLTIWNNFTDVADLKYTF